MRKKYLITIVTLALSLVIIAITVGVVTTNKIKKTSDDKYYQIMDVKLDSVNSILSDKIKLVSFNAIDYKDSVYNVYTYKTKNGEEISSIYANHLIDASNFSLTTAKEKTYELNKENTEKKYKLYATICFDNALLQITLQYEPIA